jgi:hypothetical protein
MPNQDNPSGAKETRRLLLERRTAVRFPSQLEAMVHTGGGQTGVEWPARVRDISIKGISLVVGRSFPAGTLLTVKLLREKDAPPFPVTAEVMHAMAESCGYVHGCQLTQPLSDTELSLLIQ